MCFKKLSIFEDSLENDINVSDLSYHLFQEITTTLKQFVQKDHSIENYFNLTPNIIYNRIIYNINHYLIPVQ